MNRIYFEKSILSLICVSVLAGCAAIGQRLLKQPTVTFASVGLRDVGATGATILFGLQVENPNPIEIAVDSLHYDVELGGKLISSGQTDHAISVPAHGKNIVELPVPVKYGDVFSSLTNLFGKGSTQYHLKGEAKVSVFTLPFDQTGELKLR